MQGSGLVPVIKQSIRLGQKLRLATHPTEIIQIIFNHSGVCPTKTSLRAWKPHRLHREQTGLQYVTDLVRHLQCVVSYKAHSYFPKKGLSPRQATLFLEISGNQSFFMTFSCQPILFQASWTLSGGGGGGGMRKKGSKPGPGESSNLLKQSLSQSIVERN